VLKWTFYKQTEVSFLFYLAKAALKKQSKYADNRLSKREFRTFVQLAVDEMPGADSFDYFVEFLVNSVEVFNKCICLNYLLYISCCHDIEYFEWMMNGLSYFTYSL
jgi:hypothetical protein